MPKQKHATKKSGPKHAHPKTVAAQRVAQKPAPAVKSPSVKAGATKPRPKTQAALAAMQVAQAAQGDEWITLQQQLDGFEQHTLESFTTLHRRLRDLAAAGERMLERLGDVNSGTLTLLLRQPTIAPARMLRIEAMLESVLTNLGLDVPPAVIDDVGADVVPFAPGAEPNEPDDDGDHDVDADKEADAAAEDDGDGDGDDANSDGDGDDGDDDDDADDADADGVMSSPLIR